MPIFCLVKFKYRFEHILLGSEYLLKDQYTEII